MPSGSSGRDQQVSLYDRDAETNFEARTEWTRKNRQTELGQGLERNVKKGADITNEKNRKKKNKSQNKKENKTEKSVSNADGSLAIGC